MHNFQFAPPPYPLGAFLTKVRDAGFELHQNIGTPDALTGMALIGAMSLACQGLVDVKLPTGQIRPVAVNVMSIGKSGDRKSALYSRAFAAFFAYDKAAAVKYLAALTNYKTEIAVWKTVREALLRQISKLPDVDKAVALLQAKVLAHAKTEPKKPRLRRFIRTNITERAIMDALEGDGESIGFVTDEGEQLLKSEVMRHFGLLNKAWDGAPLLTLDRADMNSVLVANPRVSVSIMTQFEVLTAYLKKYSTVARGSGFWARYLVGHPASLQGARMVSFTELTWVHSEAFNARIMELLVEYGSMLDAGNLVRGLLEFTDDAKRRFLELAANTEWMLRPGEWLHDINDFASKVMEIIARLAGLFHYFAGEAGKITLDTLERAFTVVLWHIAEFKRLFSDDCVIPQNHVDAHTLSVYLRQFIWRGMGSNSFVAKNYLLTHGPRSLRVKARLDAALMVLEQKGGIWIGVAEKTKKKFVNLIDAFFAGV